jgi:hypothetical protein
MLRNISWRTRTILRQEDHRDPVLALGQTREYKVDMMRRLVAQSCRNQIDTGDETWSNRFLFSRDGSLLAIAISIHLASRWRHMAFS